MSEKTLSRVHRSLYVCLIVFELPNYKNFSQLKQQNYIIHICIANTYLYNTHAYNTYTSFIKSDKSMRTYIFELCKNKKRIR